MSCIVTQTFLLLDPETCLSWTCCRLRITQMAIFILLSHSSHTWAFSEQVIASIIYDSHSGMNVLCFALPHQLLGFLIYCFRSECSERQCTETMLEVMRKVEVSMVFLPGIGKVPTNDSAVMSGIQTLAILTLACKITSMVERKTGKTIGTTDPALDLAIPLSSLVFKVLMGHQIIYHLLESSHRVTLCHHLIHLTGPPLLSFGLPISIGPHLALELA